MEESKPIYITAESRTDYLFQNYPECCSVFEKYDMSCSTCMGLGCDTLADCALMHGMDVEDLVRDLRICLGSPGSESL